MPREQADKRLLHLHHRGRHATFWVRQITVRKSLRNRLRHFRDNTINK